MAKSNQKKRRKKGQRRRNVAGRLMCLLQLVVSITFVVLLWIHPVLPLKERVVLAGSVVVLYFMARFFHSRLKVQALGWCCSIFVTIASLLGTGMLLSMEQTLSLVASQESEAEEMVLAVKEELPIKKVQQLKGYRIGVKKGSESTKRMVSYVEQKAGQGLWVQEYGQLEELLQGVKKGKVEAIIYNEAECNLYLQKTKLPKLKELMRYEVISSTGLARPKKISPRESKDILLYVKINQSGSGRVKEAGEENFLISLRPDSRKAILIRTPREYYLPCEGEEAGNKNTLGGAGAVGIASPVTMLEALYGVSIDGYIQMDEASLREVSENLFQGATPKEIKGQVRKILSAPMKKNFLWEMWNLNKEIKQGVCTNLSQESLCALLQMKLSHSKKWTVSVQTVDGIADQAKIGQSTVPIMWPEEGSVQMAQEALLSFGK